MGKAGWDWSASLARFNRFCTALRVIPNEVAIVCVPCGSVEALPIYRRGSCQRSSPIDFVSKFGGGNLGDDGSCSHRIVPTQGDCLPPPRV